MKRITTFASDENKLSYQSLKIGHKSSTLMKIFGRSATSIGLAEQGSSPVQTASKIKASESSGAFSIC
ncbi:hypothetical protein KIM67_01445 [Flagellimonas sp. 389]|uniref:hypothetical protein n=1 Tax=Flagellimonas sp. 389 TaxID=2835862 RepID=UPI001BD62979|nr:hypothetical protein [Flagellimonas sp. 389]MBS9461056.1 hypothetical protein [Flagellimonas sp. 389]